MIQPFISIVIPVYNMADGIHRCLHSVVGQMTDDMELLVVDDGSTDDSPIVVQAYADKDSRIHMIKQPNAGASSARNAGINAARGVYLLFIDADDEIEGDYLPNIHNQAMVSNADLLVWGIKRCYSNGHIEDWKPQMDGSFKRKDFLLVFPSQQYGRQEGLYGFVSNKLVKKDLVNCFGLRFNTDLNVQEDYDFFLDCYAHSETIYCFGETGYRYHVYDGFDKPASRRIVSYPQLIGVHNKCVNLLKKEGAWSPENEKRLFLAIGNLSLSMFLETRENYFQRVKSAMHYIWHSPYCISALESMDTRWKLLRYLLLKKDVWGTSVFVTFWRSYLFIRTRGKS